jgi:hypothetical protein
MDGDLIDAAGKNWRHNGWRCKRLDHQKRVVMFIAGMMLGCALLGANAEKGTTPPELVAKVMAQPTADAISGRPLTILQALSPTAGRVDRLEQLKIVHAYWHLSEAAADYYLSRAYVKSLDALRSRSLGDIALRSAAAEAEAQVQESASAVARRQQELAELLRSPPGTPLPRPVDPPCVGAYDTKFKALFANRTPPDKARLDERILPLERQAIDQRAKATAYAEDAAREDYRSMQDAIACCRASFEQQKAFFRLTRSYNCDIADYGLTVAPIGTDVQLLAGVLVGSAQQSSGSSSGSAGGSTGRSANGSAAGSTSASPRQQQPQGQNEPTLAPRRKTSGSTTVSPDKEWQTRKPGDFQQGSSGDFLAAGGATTPLFATLAAAQPVAKARSLAAALQNNQSLPTGFGRPLRLGDCLQRNADGNRRAVIDAYWLVRQRAGEYLAIDQQSKWIVALKEMAFNQRQNNPTDMLRLRAEQMGTEAAATEARVALIEAQFALAVRIGEVAGEAWPLASTLPHVGGYDLRLGAQPRNILESWPVRRLKETVPRLSQTALQRAAAVLEADAARADIIDKYRSGAATVSQAIDSVNSQTQQTVAFLKAVTEFNRAIGEYAVAVLPPNVSSDQLVGSLVTAP